MTQQRHDSFQGLNYGRSTGYSTAKVISDDRIREIAPSVYADAPAGGVSERYQFVPTFQVMDALRDNGYSVVQAAQSDARSADGLVVAKHMLRFRQVGDHAPRLNDTFFDIVLTNSHNRTSGFNLDVGPFRLVCDNGLVVSSGHVARIAVPHTGRACEDVIDGTGTLIREVPTVIRTLQTWQELELSEPQTRQFAKAASMLRWNGEHCPLADRADLLNTRRKDDAARNMWTVMNVIQENMLRGGQPGKDAGGRDHTTRPINSVDQIMRLNRELWGLTETMSNILTA